MLRTGLELYLPVSSGINRPRQPGKQQPPELSMSSSPAPRGLVALRGKGALQMWF